MHFVILLAGIDGSPHLTSEPPIHSKFVYLIGLPHHHCTSALKFIKRLALHINILSVDRYRCAPASHKYWIRVMLVLPIRRVAASGRLINCNFKYDFSESRRQNVTANRMRFHYGCQVDSKTKWQHADDFLHYLRLQVSLNQIQTLSNTNDAKMAGVRSDARSHIQHSILICASKMYSFIFKLAGRKMCFPFGKIPFERQQIN